MEDFIANFFSPNGPIAKELPAYEQRDDQIEMSLAIARSIAEEKHLVIEAGTGIGKSFAYLVPFILWAKENNTRVIISTNTKTLQTQLTEKDILFLKKTLGVDFNYEICMGVNNYLCKRRFLRTNEMGLFTSTAEVEQLDDIRRWASETKTGLLTELPFLPSPSLWDQIAKETDLCLGKNCPYKEECFYKEARKRQFKAHLLIANHHLFFANIEAASRVLPPYDAVVFDEAHNLENVATNYLGLVVSNFSMSYLLNKIHNLRTGKGTVSVFTKKVKNGDRILTDIVSNITELHSLSDVFFESLANKFGKEFGAKRIKKANPVENILEEPLKKLLFPLKELKRTLENEEDKIEVNSLIQRCNGVKDAILTILGQKDGNYVYWYEYEGKRRRARMSLNAAPIDISNIINEKVFKAIPVVVLTSATLTVNKSFSFLKQRLGINSGEEILLESPFDFEQQVLLYIDKDNPNPKDEDRFANALILKIPKLLKATKGRAFVLFTSYKLMDKVFPYVRDKLREISILKQGDFPRDILLKEFKEDIDSVLLGTNTFWEGIDVPGEALESVIITKLPFDVPDDPIIEARAERIESEGGNSFTDYQLPLAVIRLRQGFGRLIRNRMDIGLVAILDPRIVKKSYGHYFLNSLPKCKTVEDIDEINKVWKEIKG